MKKTFYFFLLILILFAGETTKILACSSKSNWKRYNFWPFLFYQKSLTTGAWELEILGPFYYKYHTSREEGYSFRPFFSIVKTPSQKEAFFLSPLGHFYKQDHLKRWRLLPFWSQDSFYERGKYQYRKTLGLIFWGKTIQGEKYGGFFPFYGKIKDWGNREEIHFFLWPLYVHSYYDENNSYTFLWPFFNITRGKSVYQNKIWPFYGYRRSQNEYERTFWFWPFFWKERFKVSDHEYAHKFMFFPFWEKEKSSLHYKYLILWPFFEFSYFKDLDLKTVECPWPFLRYQKGLYDQEFTLWPLVGFKATQDPLTKDKCQWRFYLWPIFSKEKCIIVDQQENPELFIENHRYFLISKIEKITDPQGNMKYKYVRIWPFWVKIKEEKGSEISFFPAIFPLKDEGFNRNYGAFFRIFERRKDPGGFQRWKLLWGLIRYDESPKESILDLSFLLSFHKYNNSWEISFLKGLLGLEKENKLSFKFLYKLKI